MCMGDPTLKFEFHQFQYSINHSNCWIFQVTNITSDSCINFDFSEIRQFICKVPGTVSCTCDFLYPMMNLCRHGLDLEGRDESAFGASFSILNSTGTVAPGIKWSILWRQARQRKHPGTKKPRITMQCTGTMRNAQIGRTEKSNAPQQHRENDNNNQETKIWTMNEEIRIGKVDKTR